MINLSAAKGSAARAKRGLFAYSRHPYPEAVCTQSIQFWVMGHDIYLSFLKYMD